MKNRRSLYIYSQGFLDEFGIDNLERQTILIKRYNKPSRKFLTDEELEDFIHYLESNQYLYDKIKGR